MLWVEGGPEGGEGVLGQRACVWREVGYPGRASVVWDSRGSGRRGVVHSAQSSEDGKRPSEKCLWAWPGRDGILGSWAGRVGSFLWAELVKKCPFVGQDTLPGR